MCPQFCNMTINAKAEGTLQGESATGTPLIWSRNWAGRLYYTIKEGLVFPTWLSTDHLQEFLAKTSLIDSVYIPILLLGYWVYCVSQREVNLFIWDWYTYTHHIWNSGFSRVHNSLNCKIVNWHSKANRYLFSSYYCYTKSKVRWETNQTWSAK